MATDLCEEQENMGMAWVWRELRPLACVKKWVWRELRTLACVKKSETKLSHFLLWNPRHTHEVKEDHTQEYDVDVTAHVTRKGFRSNIAATRDQLFLVTQPGSPAVFGKQSILF